MPSGNELLQRFIDSDHFNNDPSLAVAYLSRYANHVGIQYVLCSKLRQFAYEEIEFFLPQLCHLLVSVETSSMGLEEFIIDLCQESVSGALLTFWLFQTHLHDLSNNPQSNSFKTCRRIFNKIQHIVFGTPEPLRAEKIYENILPTTVLASIILASVAAPFFPKAFGPLAIAQARKPRPLEDTISETPTVQPPPKLSRSQTISSFGHRHRKSKSSRENVSFDGPLPSALVEDATIPIRPPIRPRKSSKAVRKSLPPSRAMSIMNVQGMPSPSTTSLPETGSRPSTSTRLNSSASYFPSSPFDDIRIPPPPFLGKNLSTAQKTLMLRLNYFRSQTQFLSALEGISNRLVVLPKPARLSALRAELALIGRDLPAEVDIPLLCPATLDDGAPSRSKHHRIVRLNPAEATSLNSAERVPYLLMIEVLREDFDFDPDSTANQRLLADLLSEKDTSKRRIFDITGAKGNSSDYQPPVGEDSVFEPANGDLSSANLLRDFSDGDGLSINLMTDNNVQRFKAKTPPPRLSSGTTTPSSLLTPHLSDHIISRAGSPSNRQNAMSTKARPEQTDFNALATHMRTAAQMLAQLDVSGSKRPRQETEIIKAKIIASMQNLEEENFTTTDEPSYTASFDTIMAGVDSPKPGERPEDILEGAVPAPDAAEAGAGAARMENDQKTGGVRRKGDRDDPSAATFGEDWKSKRERIRRTSPYGMMDRWDLLSVIVKTGSDLRQELFACQLIRICAKIWEEAGVPVWVKQMRILVTGESAGLIETITNGVSLHSLKRSLTLSSIAAGTNPRKRFATLKDHFVKTFGEVGSTGYRAGEDAFMRSLAAYSMLSYILQLKDRHNGNILIDNVGHIIHIDFGFILSNSPGSVGFEAAPFKLTSDYVEVLGGVHGAGFEAFKALCKESFQALRKSAENIVSVVEMMGKESKMACFASGAMQTTAMLRARFMLHLSREEAEAFVENDLIGKSLGSYYTRLYDTFQYRTQGIY